MCDEHDPYGCELDDRTYCAECDAVVVDDYGSGPRCEACDGQLCERCEGRGVVVCKACDAKRTAEMSFEEIGEIPVLEPIAARPVTFVYPKDDNDMILEGSRP
jgi:hypothetical protein